MKPGPAPRYRLGVELGSQVLYRKLLIVDRVQGGWKVWVSNDEGFSSGTWVMLSDTGVITRVSNEQEIELWREE